MASRRSHRPLPDHLRPGLRILFVGINPGVRSAQTGHHFAGHSNRFWKLLYESGLVTEPLTYRGIGACRSGVWASQTSSAAPAPASMPLIHESTDEAQPYWNEKSDAIVRRSWQCWALRSFAGFSRARRNRDAGSTWGRPASKSSEQEFFCCRIRAGATPLTPTQPCWRAFEPFARKSIHTDRKSCYLQRAIAEDVPRRS